MAFEVKYLTVKGNEKVLRFKSVSDACMITGIPYAKVIATKELFMTTITQAFADILGERLGVSRMECYDILDPDGHMEEIRKEIKSSVSRLRTAIPKNPSAYGYTKDGPFESESKPVKDESFLGLEEVYPGISKIYKEKKEYSNLRLEYGERLLIALELNGAPDKAISYAIQLLSRYNKWVKSLDGSTLEYAITSIMYLINVRLTALYPLDIQSREVTEHNYREAKQVIQEDNEYMGLQYILALIGGRGNLQKFNASILNMAHRAYIFSDGEKNFEWTENADESDYASWVRLKWWNESARFGTMLGLCSCLIEANRYSTVEELRSGKLTGIKDLSLYLETPTKLSQIDREAFGSINNLRATLVEELNDFNEAKKERLDYQRQIAELKLLEKQERERKNAIRARKRAKLEAEAASRRMPVALLIKEKKQVERIKKANELKAEREMNKRNKDCLTEKLYMQARTEGPSSGAWGRALLSRSKTGIIWWYTMGEARAKAELNRIYSESICYTTEDLTSLLIIAYKDSILKDIKSGLDIFEAVINKANPSKRDILEDMFDPVHAVRCFGISRQKLDDTASILCSTNKNLDPTEIWIKAATGLILEAELAGVS